MTVSAVAFSPGEDPSDRTRLLFERIRAGDRNAENELLQRYRPLLVQWAHGRLPAYARSYAETQDLVQSVLIHAFLRLKKFEPRRRGAFHVYLRTMMKNEIRTVIRKAQRRPMADPLPDNLPCQGDSPIGIAIGSELERWYETCLARLAPEQAEAMVLHELGFTYKEIAEILDLSSVDAARMKVARAIVRLSTMMGRKHGEA